MWADPAKDGAWGSSICGALSASVGPDPWDYPGQAGKKACRETSQQWSMSQESAEIYEQDSEQARPSYRVPSKVTKVQTQKEIESQRALQDSVSRWLLGQPRNEDQRIFMKRQLERALSQVNDDDLIDLDSIMQDRMVFDHNPFLGDDQ